MSGIAATREHPSKGILDRNTVDVTLIELNINRENGYGQSWISVYYTGMTPAKDTRQQVRMMRLSCIETQEDIDAICALICWIERENNKANIIQIKKPEDNGMFTMEVTSGEQGEVAEQYAYFKLPQNIQDCIVRLFPLFKRNYAYLW